MGFDQAVGLQERLRREILAGHRNDTLLLLEHDPIITLGRGADPSHLLWDAASLASHGIAVAHASRGGDVTYHGPGQLVGYPVVRLRSGVRAHVRGMAAAIIEVLSRWGIHGSHYRDDAPGVWVARGRANAGGPDTDDQTEHKIAAFGINVHHRIAIHGFALNVSPRLQHFSAIVPCGLAGAAVTSVEEILGAAPALAQCASELAQALEKSLGIGFRRLELPSELLCQVTHLK